MKVRSYFLALLCAVSALQAEEFQPWLGNVYEFETKALYEFAESSKVSLAHGDKSRSLHSNLFQASLGFTPHPEWDVAVDLSFAETTWRDFGYDRTKVAFRHLWLDDVTGDDLVSLTSGVSLSLQQNHFLRDISLIRHGSFETLFHAALGKEFDFTEKSYYRAWAMGAIGVANQGSCWAEGKAHLNWIYDETHFLDLFAGLEKGYGNKKLHSVSKYNFPGYAHLDYHFGDIGLRYDYQITTLGKIYAQVKRRICARYCPKNQVAVEVGINIPFSF